MIDLCELATCRRRSLLAYFGEETPPCGTCDLCRGGASLYDATMDAQKALSAVARTGERFGAGHIADVLCGEATDSIRRTGHDRLKTFGAGRERNRRAWIVTVRQLFAAGALAEASADHGGFCLTALGKDILFGRERIELRAVPDQPPTRRERRRDQDARRDGLDPDAAALFEHLRATRLQLARSEGIAAFMVFPDRTLMEMAARRPRDAAALRSVHGVGERKLERYGEAFLASIAEWPG